MIRHSNERFFRSHWKQPRGKGSWAFEVDLELENFVHVKLMANSGITYWAPGQLTVTEAKAWIAKLVQGHIAKRRRMSRASLLDGGIGIPEVVNARIFLLP